MAPPVFNKRGPSLDPQDAGNRVSKTTSALNRKSGTSITNPRSTLHENFALHKSSIIEKNFGAEQFSIDDQADMADNDVGPKELSIITINSDPFEEDFPRLSGISDLSFAKSTTESSKINEEDRSATLLMDSIKGLLDLTIPYLQKLEEVHPGIGTDFMALLADGASRAMRGKRVYTKLLNMLLSNPKVSKSSRAEKAGAAVNGRNISLKKQTIRALPPVGKLKKTAE